MLALSTFQVHTTATFVMFITGRMYQQQVGLKSHDVRRPTELRENNPD